MRRPRWISTLGVLSLTIVAGCEDLPLTAALASLTASPTPGPSTSMKPSESPRPSASPTASGSPRPGSPEPSRASDDPDVPAFPEFSFPPIELYSPSPVPRTSPTASPGPSVPLSFDLPLAAADFTKELIDVKLSAGAAGGVALKSLAITYDGVELKRDDLGARSLSITGWNPQVVNSVDGANLAQVPFGPHVLRGVATTKAGVVSSTELRFEKPFIMRGWRPQEGLRNGLAVAIPKLQTGIEHPAVIGVQGRLFSFFGESEGGFPVEKLQMLNLNLADPVWSDRDRAGLSWRKRPGVAADGDFAYLVGGELDNGAGGSNPTSNVVVMDLFQNRLLSAPALPIAISDLSVAIVGHVLYAVGGTLNGGNSGVSERGYKLTLNSDGRPGDSAWQTLAPLPNGIGRSGASLIPLEGKLYLLGGVTESGQRAEPILKYDPGAARWTREGLLPRGVSGAAAAALAGKIWLFGGDTDLGGLSRDTISFEPNSGIVKTYDGDKNLPAARGAMGAAVVNGSLYLVGGHVMDADHRVPSDSVIRADAF